MVKSRGTKLLGALPVAIAVMCSGSCTDTSVTCGEDELRYAGRPAQAVFAYDDSCRVDCFSAPEDGKSCKRECAEVEVAAPAGWVESERFFQVVDHQSLAPGRALVYRFGFLDEANGVAPDGWTLLSGGRRSYQTGEVQGTSRFLMETWVAEQAAGCTSDSDCGSGLCHGVDGARYCGSLCEPPAADAADTCADGRSCRLSDEGRFFCAMADPIPAGSRWISGEGTGQRAAVDPGTLKITLAQESRLKGRFFLGYQSAIGSPVGQVEGCFDVRLGPVDGSFDGTQRRPVVP